VKSAVLEKILSRLDQIDPGEVQSLLSRLVREKGFLQKVFEALQEGVLLLDSSGGISFINHAGCRFFGTTPEEAQGCPLDQVVRGVDWRSLMESFRRTVIVPERDKRAGNSANSVINTNSFFWG